MGGKRQANTLSAIIQNFDTVEKVIETSANSAGSALKENERYLDSIQGRIDLFTNSVQTMWSNALDSDVIKRIVDFGTELIKIVDTIGLIPSLLVAIGSFKGFSVLFKILKDGGLTVKALTSSLWSYLTGVKAVNAVNVKQIVTERILRANWIQSLATQKLKEIQEKKLAAAKAHLEFVQKRYIIGVGTAEQVERAEMLVKEASIGVDITKISTTELLSLAFKKLAANILATLKALGPLAAVGAAIFLVTKAVDGLTKTTKELKEKYDDVNRTLDDTNSALSDIESKLKDIQDQIKDINAQDSLSFTDQEELQRLQAQTVELQRQQALYKELKKAQAKDVNSSALAMANNYADTGVYTGETTGELSATTGTWGAIGVGVAGAIAGGMGLGSSIGIAGGPIGIIIGGIVGAIVGGVVGLAVGTITGAIEKDIGDSLDSMKEQYEKLKKEYDTARENYQAKASDGNKKKFEKAQEALNSYQSNMANYMSEMDLYYSQIKQNWDVATTEQKKAYTEWQDTMDTWAIQSGSANAKSNMFARIFGDDAEGNFAKVRDQIAAIKEEIKKAQESGDETALEEALAKLESFQMDGILSDEDIARIREMGAYLYEAKDYFREVIESESEFVDLPLEDVAKDINKISSGLDDLKEAFDEVIDKGYLTAKTLMSLKESLGALLNLSDISATDDENVLAAWAKYQEVLMSGVATTEQMTDATEDLAKSILDSALENNNLTPETKWEYVVQLQGLGVENAQEYIEKLLQKNMVNELEESMHRNSGLLLKSQKQAILDKYSVEENAISDVIEKLQEKQKIESTIALQEKKQSQYDIFRQEYEKVKEDLDIAKKGKATRVGDAGYYVDAYKGEDGLIHYGGYSYNGKYYSNPDDVVSVVNEESLYIAQQAYDKIKNTYSEYFDEQGNIKTSIPIEVDTNIITAQNELERLQQELNAQSPEIQLKLNLQDFDDGVDKIQTAYSTLKDITTEYNTQGYLSLDNLQALLNLSPEYLSVLQMEGGQLTINQSALEAMLKTKLDDAEATAVQTAITQLNALAQRKEEDAIKDTGSAIEDAILNMGSYSTALGTVAKDAISAAGSVAIFNAALKDAENARDSGLVTDDEINQILSNFNNSVNLINSVRDNLSSSFNNILDPGSKTSPEEVAESEWDKLVAQYENKLALITNERDLIEAEIDKAEARGGQAAVQYYKDLIRSSKEEKNLLEEQYTAMQNYLDANADTIDQDTWTEYNNSLNKIAVSIKECETNTIKWQEALREIDIHYFEQATDEISRLKEELEFVDGLLEDEDVADENGNWSSAALTRMALYMNQIEAAAVNTQRYQDEIANLNEQYENGELSEEQYQERLATLTSGLYDSINAQEDARDSIIELNDARIDAIKEGIEKEIEAYEDYINVVKESLNAERDLYDFKKKVKNESKNIAELERRIASLSGSTNAADIASRRKLEAELMQAKESLNDTYYDHSKDAQQNALDSEAESYKKSQEKRIEELEKTLDNIELLIQNSMMDVLLNADIVYNELNGIADTYGIKLSDELTQPWKDASAQATMWKTELQNSMTSGEYAALIGEGGAITGFANGVASKLSGSWSTAQSAVEKYSNFLTSTELGNKFSGAITGFANQIQSIVNKWDEVKNAADSAYQAQLRVQNVGGNSNVGSGSGSSGGGGTGNTVSTSQTPAPANQIDDKILSKYNLTPEQVFALGYGPISLKQFETLLRTYQIKYSAVYKQVANTRDDERALRKVVYGQYVSGPLAVRQYAKGTTDIDKNQLAIVDELGEELILHANPTTGRLEYLTKGSGVVPSDLTSEIMELGKIGVDGLMDMNKFGANINMISNAVNKPEFNLSVENFLRCDNVSQDSLPELKQFVKTEMNNMIKQMNYAIKGKGAR